MKRYKKDINPANGRFELPVVYLGREYKLSKREQSPAAPWYVRIERKGKAYLRSTDTADAELAQNKAKTLLGAILNGDKTLLESTKLRDPLKYATVAQVCDTYERLATVVRPRGPVNTLRFILRTVFGEKVVVDEITTDRLTGKVVRDYQANAVAAVRTRDLDTPEYRAALRRAQYSANSTWNQARSVFVPGMMAKYRDAGLVFPANFEAEFVRAPKIKGVKRPMYSQPQDELIQRTLRAHQKVMDAAVRLQFAGAGDMKAQRAVMVALELGAGLRNGEVLAAHGSWFGEVNGHFCITLPAEATKDGKPSHERLPPEFEKFVRTYLEVRKVGPKDRLVPSGERVTRAVSRWMRLLGWTGSKTNHALRKFFGYRVAVQHGIGVAQRKLRHKQIATTQNFYTGILSGDDVVVTFAGPEPGKIVPMSKTG